MKMRYVYLLVASLLFGMIPMEVFGESTYDKDLEDVILRVKKLFYISDSYDTFNSQINSNDNGVYFYLNWSDSKNELPNINVNTDSKGNINSYNVYNVDYIKPSTNNPNITRDEALIKAKQFIQRIDPKIYMEARLEDNIQIINAQDTIYSFSFTRFIGDIPYPDNSININVDKFTGEINNYYANWEKEVAFPNVEKVISIEDGKQAFKDKIGLELMYKYYYRLFKMTDNNQETKFYLAYSLKENNKAIDAITGESINLGYFGPMMRSEKEMAAGGEGGISPQERADIEKLSGILDVYEIEKKSRETLGLDISYKLQSSNLYSSYKNPGEFQWSLYFVNDIDENNLLTADITLNAKTSELISFYRDNGYNSKEKATISKTQALEMAQDYLSKIQPVKAKEVELVEVDLQDNQLSYYFKFIRKVEDIYVESDSISIGIDAVNNEISSYSLDWYNGTLPPKGDTIGLDKAYGILFNDIGYRLKYATIYKYEKSGKQTKEIKLVYSIDPNKIVNMDAHSGTLLDYAGEPYKDNKPINYTDVDKSYAKDKIKTLSEYGVGFNSDKFNPRAKIKQKDFIFLLFKSMNSYRTETEEDIEQIYKELINSQIMLEAEKSLDKIVTKEDAVKFVVRAMGYGKVAEISNIYIDLFPDSKEIQAGYKGYLNIAYGLGIIKGDGTGLIRPNYELNREDAASIIYNYMFN